MVWTTCCSSTQAVTPSSRLDLAHGPSSSSRNSERQPLMPAGKRVAWNVAHLHAPRMWSEFGNTGSGAVMNDHAVAAGLLLVRGAGNFRVTQPIPVQQETPKDVPSVISVGGIDTLLALVSFSNMGPAEWSSVALYGDYRMPAGLIKPELVAYPGEGFPVLGISDSGYIDTDKVRFRCNSFAGPQMAGIAALILSDRPALSVWRMREILERMANDLGASGTDNMLGFGLVDAFAAVKMAPEGSPRVTKPALLGARH